MYRTGVANKAISVNILARLKLASEYFGGKNSEIKIVTIARAVAIFFSVKSCCKVYHKSF